MASVDASIKRLYPALLAGTVALVAYLQARGISNLVAEQLPTFAPPPAPRAARAGQSATSAGRDRSAQTVLARNAFDSVTGPITGAKPTASAPPPPAPVGDPEDAPPCPSGSVVLIADSEDPAFSFALIKSGSEAKMRRIGDDVEGKKVELIGWDRVVLGSGSERCSLRMHETKGGEASSALTDTSEGGRRPMPTAPTSPVASADITKVSETEYVIERGGPEKMTQMQQAFMKSARAVDGKGIRLHRASQSTILGQLGMKKGDMVKSINGFDMTDPDKAVEAYGRLKTAKSVKVVLERDGQSVTLDYTIK